MRHESTKAEAIGRLQSLRNIGPATARRLYSIGIRTPEQVRYAAPTEMYEKLREKAGGRLDRCVLYQLWGAVLNVPWWECKSLCAGVAGKSDPVKTDRSRAENSLA